MYNNEVLDPVAADLSGLNLGSCAGSGDYSRELSRLRERYGKEELLSCGEQVPVWQLCMAAIALYPAVFVVPGYDSLGKHSLICTPCPVDFEERDEETGIRFEVFECRQQTIVSVYSDPIRLDYLKFDSLVVPPVNRGQTLYVRGDLPHPVIASMALTYSMCMESIWIPNNDSEKKENEWEDVCVYSRDGSKLGMHTNKQIRYESDRFNA